MNFHISAGLWHIAYTHTHTYVYTYCMQYDYMYMNGDCCFCALSEYLYSQQSARTLNQFIKASLTDIPTRRVSEDFLFALSLFWHRYICMLLFVFFFCVDRAGGNELCLRSTAQTTSMRSYSRIYSLGYALQNSRR